MSRDLFSNNFDLRRKAEELRKFAELRGKNKKVNQTKLVIRKGLWLPIKNMVIQWRFGKCTNKRLFINLMLRLVADGI
ncbi:hypothetical protein GB937_010340 [Aspergillus fischeri]|nr:hypothetical protein GB937_010340 [Aspergillus fischeri]